MNRVFELSEKHARLIIYRVKFSGRMGRSISVMFDGRGGGGGGRVVLCSRFVTLLSI